jgi:uncharacterized RDD family membrane protein YckC
MRCPSCGAVCKKRSMKCPECGAFRNRTWVQSEAAIAVQTELPGAEAATFLLRSHDIRKSSPSLIEFPSPGRQPIPQWRKELGERVREIQERRAREAMLESGGLLVDDAGDEQKPGRSLELLSRPESQPTNPLVIAALRRIERAHASSPYSGNAAVATAAVYHEQADYEPVRAQPAQEISAAAETQAEEPTPKPEPPPEKTHYLTVVASQPVPQTEPPTIEDSGVADNDPLPNEATVAVKPKRLIRDNDPALDYLDSVPTTVLVDYQSVRSAPAYARIFSALLDFIVVGVISAPVVALVKLTDLQWQDPRVITFAAGTAVVAAFLYFTISTALSGRTLAMRIFSLRAIDARTGLIPTGTQSAGRAFFYLLSLGTAGIGLVFSLVDRERRTVHDRFTRTAVVRV